MFQTAFSLRKHAYAEDQWWFGTNEFCRLYLDPPAEQTYRCTNASTGYWRYRVIGRKLIRTEVFTPAPPTQMEIANFVHFVGCDVASFELMPQSWVDGLDAHDSRIRITSGACDYVVSLPGTIEEYIAARGAKTRKHLRRADRLIKRELGSRLTCEHLFRAEIGEATIRSLVRLNTLRLTAKGHRKPWTEREIAHWAQLARQCGVLCLLKVDGAVVAGSLSFFRGGEVFLGVIAHSPEFDRFRLGVVCLLRTIEQLIECRFHMYHLLWGDSTHRERFGGAPVQLARVLYFPRWYYAKAWDFAMAMRIPLLLRMWRDAKNRLHLRRGFVLPGLRFRLCDLARHGASRPRCLGSKCK